MPSENRSADAAKPVAERCRIIQESAGALVAVTRRYRCDKRPAKRQLSARIRLSQTKQSEGVQAADLAQPKGIIAFFSGDLAGSLLAYR
ncbi:hypothetical protein [Parapedobacter defluvii]|uniref:hypothetical protein n=1 Tax=Parapedobacter defluvii TaxID=2045106 RepID=UPI00166DECE0|nr:hypothetical protein [Parapedobacter defluvii]